MEYLDPIRALLLGVNGAVLSVLANAAQPLTVRQIADRAGCSHPAVGDHLARLESLGVVRRHIAGRSHLVTLTGSAAAKLIRRLAMLRDDVLTEMRDQAAAISPAPDSLIVFGSFARGTAHADSDIDVLIVAPSKLIDDQTWQSSVSAWINHVSEFAGNPVAEIVESAEEVAERLDEPVWRSIRNEGIVLIGRALDDLSVPAQPGGFVGTRHGA